MALYAEWNQLFDQNQNVLLHFEDLEGQEHILYGVPEGPQCKALQDYVQARTLVIADGHHRYETAVNYRRMMKENTGKNPEKEAWGYVYAIDCSSQHAWFISSSHAPGFKKSSRRLDIKPERTYGSHILIVFPSPIRMKQPFPGCLKNPETAMRLLFILKRRVFS